MKFIRLTLLFLLLCQSVFIYAQTTGTFEPVPNSPFPAGEVPVSVAYSPQINGNLFAAVTNAVDNTVSVYQVDLTTGEFIPVVGSPFATGLEPQSVAFSPEVNGNLFAAVVNASDNTVSVYQVDLTTGEFNPVTNSPFATGTFPQSVAFSPEVNGNLFAAVVNVGNNTVSVYQVDPTTGEFTPVPNSPFATGNEPQSVAFSPEVNGTLLAAVTNGVSNTVSVYQVNLTTGEFIPVVGSPVEAGFYPRSVAFSPEVNGNFFAAVVNLFGNSVSVYQVDFPTGEFTPVAGSPFETGPAPYSVDFSPEVNENFFAAVANDGNNTVSVYQVDSTGEFVPVNGSPFPTGLIPRSVAFSPEVNGSLFAAVANSDSANVSVYQVLLPPTVDSLTPFEGPSTGGTTVIIEGTNFTGATAVYFGTTPASSFVVDSPNQITAVSPPGVGYVDVTVTTPVGTSQATSFATFLYLSSPTVTNVTPSQGPTVGGTNVVITGNNFTGATAVYFGETPAVSFTVNSANQITAVSPAGQGTVDVRVVAPGGTSATSTADQFTYISAPLPPTVTSVTPSTGPSMGGTSVIITGTNFTGATAVYFGTTPALSFTVDSDSQITVVSPAGQGSVDVRVVAPGGTSAVSASDQFTYISASLLPTVTSVTPSTGPSTGGTSVIITGTNFIGATAVYFGATPALSFTVNSDNQITAVSPVGQGTVNVRVVTLSGTSTTSVLDRFTYISEPLPPTQVRGCQKIKKCGKHGNVVNVIKWDAPIDQASIVAYQIYQDKSLSKLAGAVPSSETLKFKDCRRKKGKVYKYFVVSVNELGDISESVKVKVKKPCHKKHQHKRNILNFRGAGFLTMQEVLKDWFLE